MGAAAFVACRSPGGGGRALPGAAAHPPGRPVLIARPALLVAVTAGYAAGLLWLMALDVERWRRNEFNGWQVILRERVARVAAPAPPILGSGYFARRRWHRVYGWGWRRLQRHRIACQRWDRAMR